MKAAQLSVLPSIKYLMRFGSDPVGTMRRIRKSYGDFAVVKLGTKRVFFCFHPDLVSDVFKTNQTAFRKSRIVFDQIIPLTGKRGLVQLEGKDGLTHRRLTIPPFSSANLATYLPRFKENFISFESEIRPHLDSGSIFDLAPYVSRLVLRNALSMVVGKFEQEDVEEILECFLQINNLCGGEIKRRSSVSFFTQRSRALEISEVEVRLRRKIQKLIQKSSLDSFASLLSHLLQEKIEVLQIEHHLRTFLFAGFETTATSVLMSLYLLAKNPETVLQIQKNVRNCNFEEMSSLRSQAFLLNSYKESLRLYPPSWTLAREATRDTTIGAEAVRSGDQIFFGLSDIHRHENFWKKPDDFLPDRFNQDPTHEYVFLPFGAGTRICIGMQTAYIEACYVLGKFFQNYEVRLANNFFPKMAAQITSHPTNGLPVRVAKVL